MDNFYCPNHGEWPPLCYVDKKEFKKNIWGKVNRLEITCHCPVCGMRLTYKVEIQGYKRSK